ncbi:MAG: 3-deoxy-8-phosphooctulonate synthase [Candidatus Hydrothermae bacterium]|nr:3-deoxy-8-phosphooctulonate synthase [Candidatus Hydrothermae bacterium]
MSSLPRTREIQITETLTVGGNRPFALIAGPCVIESRDLVMQVAEHLRTVTDRLEIPLIFKASFWKDNRSSAEYFRGPGPEEGLRVLEEVKRTFDIPVLTDVHLPEQAAMAAEVVDVIQVPAFLCMQTSLTEAVARTGKPVNVKKGQFLAPEDVQHIYNKYIHFGNPKVMFTERGTAFGYHNLVVDFRSLPTIRSMGHPVVMDATHPVRRYGVPSKDPRGGSPELIPYIARAGVAVGTDLVFIETHPDPPSALSDASSMLPMGRLEDLLRQLRDLDRYIKTGAWA